MMIEDDEERRTMKETITACCVRSTPRGRSSSWVKRRKEGAQVTNAVLHETKTTNQSSPAQ
jgi:hypothetical protein